MRLSPTQRGFRRLLRIPGERPTTFSLLSGKGTVRGLFSVNPPVELPSELLEEKREKALLEVERPAHGSIPIERADKLKDSAGNTWQAWSREDNPATFTTKFWLVKLVKGKDV